MAKVARRRETESSYYKVTALKHHSQKGKLPVMKTVGKQNLLERCRLVLSMFRV